MKRVFLVHGWEGSPENCWFPWLKRELEARGFEVYAPAMPDTDHPKIEPWVSTLKEQVGEPDEGTYLIGHSIGCQTIMRYLQGLPEDTRVGGVIFVAGWISLTPMATRDEKDKKIVEPWYNEPLYFDKIKQKTDNFVAIFSDDDPYVPQEKNVNTYKEKLGAKIIVESGKGHFSDDDGVTEIPIVLDEIVRMSGD